MKYYESPMCRVKDLDLETALLNGSTEDYPLDPFDPEFDG